MHGCNLCTLRVRVSGAFKMCRKGCCRSILILQSVNVGVNVVTCRVRSCLHPVAVHQDDTHVVSVGGKDRAVFQWKYAPKIVAQDTRRMVHQPHLSSNVQII